MSTASRDAPKPHLRDPHVLAELQAYWEVYDRVAKEARAAALAELRSYGSVDEEVAAAFDDEKLQERLRPLLARAITHGEWEPFLSSLRETGAAFAQMGLGFGDWFAALNAIRRHTVPHLVEAYDDDRDRLTASIRGKGTFFDVVLQTIGEAYLATREETIAKQRAAIEELSTPVLRIRPGMLLLPVVGVVDSTRSRHFTEALLQAVQDNRARVVVMDITGVHEVDSEVANRLIQAAEAARLMGATPIITGISTAVAQTLVTVGVDLKGLRTVGDLQTGIEEADELLGITMMEEEPNGHGGNGWPSRS